MSGKTFDLCQGLPDSLQKSTIVCIAQKSINHEVCLHEARRNYCLGLSTSAVFLRLNLGQALAAEVEWCLPWIGHICPPQTSTLASTAHKSASQYWQLAALLRRRRKVQILFPALLSFSRALIGDKATDWRTQPLHNLRFARNCQLHKERDYEIHPFLFECKNLIFVLKSSPCSSLCKWDQRSRLLLPFPDPSSLLLLPLLACTLVPLVLSESRFLFCSSKRLLLLFCLSPCSPSCPFCALLKAASSFPLLLLKKLPPPLPGPHTPSHTKFPLTFQLLRSSFPWSEPLSSTQRS